MTKQRFLADVMRFVPRGASLCISVTEFWNDVLAARAKCNHIFDDASDGASVCVLCGLRE